MIKYVSNRVRGDGGTKQKYFVTDLVVVTDGITKCKITVISLRSWLLRKQENANRVKSTTIKKKQGTQCLSNFIKIK